MRALLILELGIVVTSLYLTAMNLEDYSSALGMWLFIKHAKIGLWWVIYH